MTRFWISLLIVPQLAPAWDVDDWPRWRGPNNDGVARGDVPLEFGEEKNVAWKMNIPGRGFSSPVIWGDRLFLTTAIPSAAAPAPGAASEGGGGGRGGPGGGAAAGMEHKFVVMAIDRHSGKTVWQHTAATASPHEGYHQRYGSFASNSPVTDGKHLVAFFGSRGVYCYDLDGKLIWQKQLTPLRMRNAFGEGTAAVLDGDKVILSMDQQSGSYILVLDKNTGKEIWKKDRDEISAWAQPLVVNYKGQKQVIVSATNKVRSYDLANGDLIWECAGLGPNVIPAPVLVNGEIVIVMSGFRDPNLLAIRLGRKGDLTGTDAIVWTNQRGNSYTPSPVLQDGKLYFLTDNGMLNCFEAATGKPFYAQQRLPKPYNFKASPVAVNGKLYLSSENDDVIVVKMGEKFEVLATNTFKDQMFISSPAVAGGSMYLRSHDTLYCIRGR